MIYHISPKSHLFQIPFSQLTPTSATFNQLENATLILEHFRTKRKLNRNLATVRRGTPRNNKKTRKPPKWWMELGLHTEDHDGDDRATKKTFNYPRSPPEDWAFCCCSSSRQWSNQYRSPGPAAATAASAGRVSWIYLRGASKFIVWHSRGL